MVDRHIITHASLPTAFFAPPLLKHQGFHFVRSNERAAKKNELQAFSHLFAEGVQISCMAQANSVSQIESLATRKATRCGTGSMVWRVWGDARPLVLLHGASGSWTHWIRNIAPLAKRFRVIVPDLPGFGDSDLPPEPHTADMLADLVASGLDTVVPPSMEFDVAGFSFGGIIAGLVAARMGDRVRTLVLFGPGGMGLAGAPRPPLLKIRPEMVPAEIERIHRGNLRTLMIADPLKIDELAIFLHIENLRRARFKSGNIPDSDVLLRALPAIRARITGIYGGCDAIAGSRLDDYRLALASVQRDLDFRVIAGVGHWVIYEAADEANALLHDMVRANS